jgi:hypothetical protein
LSETKVDSEKRNTLKYAATAVIAGLVAEVGGYYVGASTTPGSTTTNTAPGGTTTVTTTKTVTGTTTTTTAKPPTGLLPGAPTTLAHPIRWSGGSWAMYPEVVTDAKNDLGYDVTSDIISYEVIATKLIASGGVGWDVCLGSYHTYSIVKSGVVKPIAMSAVPRWEKGHMSSIEEDPHSVLKNSIYADMLAEGLWVKGQEGVMTYGISPCSNWDSIGYNPEFLPYDERGNLLRSASMEDVLNPDNKKFGIGYPHGPTEFFGYLGNYLEKSGQMSFGRGVSDPTKQEIDAMADYIAPYIKDGQFKTFWVDYGECVSILSTREVCITPTWEPAVMDCRRAGTPSYYAASKWGVYFWRSPDMISTKTDLPDLAINSFLNWRSSPTWTRFITRNGYTTSAYLWDDIRTFMGPEFYDWHHLGRSTYKSYQDWMPIVWPERPEFAKLDPRIGNGLFLPDKYNWSMTEGKTSTTGNYKSQGSVEDKNSNTGFVQYWPQEADYFVESLTRLVAMKPK